MRAEWVRYLNSCKQLWMGVLYQALHDLTDNASYAQEGRGKNYIEVHRKNTYTWFNKPINTKADIGSFLWICDMLEFNPEYIRRRAADLYFKRCVIPQQKIRTIRRVG